MLQYKNYTIYEKNGVYTVGWKYNVEFNDCSLENLETGTIQETDMVLWNMRHGNTVSFPDCRTDREEDFEKYVQHFVVYNSNIHFIVPIVTFSSIEKAEEFIDWIICQEPVKEYYEKENVFAFFRKNREELLKTGIIKELYDNAVDIQFQTDSGYFRLGVYCYYENEDFLHPKVGEICLICDDPEEIDISLTGSGYFTEKEISIIQNILDRTEFKEFQFGKESVEKEEDTER